MKHLIIICLLLPLLGFSQRKTNESKSYPKLAKVMIFRENMKELKNKPSPIRLNGEYLTTLWNNSRYNYEFYPQNCLFKLATDNPVEVSFKAYAGEVYYLKIYIVKVGEDYRQVMEQMQEADAKKFLEENKLRNLGSYNPVVDSVRAVKTKMNWAGTDVFSLGVLLGQGQGFEHANMVSLISGGSSRISGGGGVIFGFDATYRFTPRLALQGEFLVLGSTLFPPVSNATASFDRLELGLSPRYTLPFGRKFRFNVGPGIATFPSIKLTTDFTKLTNGFKGEFDYKAGTAFYISSDIEFYFRSCSFGMGLKYTHANYTLNKATVNGTVVPLDDPQLDYYRDFSGDGIHIFAVFRVHM